MSYHCSHGQQGECFQCTKDQAAARTAGFAEGVARAERIAGETWEWHNDPRTEQRAAFGDGARAVALVIKDRIRALSPEPDSVLVSRATLERVREALIALSGQQAMSDDWWVDALAALDGVLGK